MLLEIGYGEASNVDGRAFHELAAFFPAIIGVASLCSFGRNT
jgi:hypothetical protein